MSKVKKSKVCMFDANFILRHVQTVIQTEKLLFDEKVRIQVMYFYLLLRVLKGRTHEETSPCNMSLRVNCPFLSKS